MQWEKFEEGYSVPVKSWCAKCDDGTAKQVANLAKHPVVFDHVALMPDAHFGYGMPIGGVVACTDAVIPAAVGVDIGCGMIATETDIPTERFADMAFRRAFQDKLKRLIPVGEGVSHKDQQEWDGFELYQDGHAARAQLWPSVLDRKNLGTLGGGNHFVELQKTTALDGNGDPEGGSKVWLMIHSGSRNLGARVEAHYQKIANRFCQLFHAPLADPNLAFLPIEERDGHDYYEDMFFALRYAKENRRRMSRAAASTNLTVEECDRAMDGIVCERWHESRKCRGHFDLSEAPQAYKDIESVIDSERDLIEPLVRLVPLACLKG